MPDLSFDQQLAKWQAFPPEIRERVLDLLTDIAQLMRTDDPLDAVALDNIVALMRGLLPNLQDIEWLNAQRTRAIEKLQREIVAQAEEVQQTAAVWSTVDGDGL